jgi:colanic acid biosynthesis glycosyl transferase WcaI
VADAAHARGARTIHWIQDIYPEIVAAHFGRLAAWPLRPLRWRRNAAWRAASACVVLGESMAQKVIDEPGSAERVLVIPNWAPRELERTATDMEMAERRCAWGLSERFIVAYSGNLGRVHDFATVLDAAERLRERSDIIFLFVGRGPRFHEVATAVEKRRLSNVRLLPPESRECLAAALAAADAQLVTLKPAFADLVYPSKLAGVLAAGRPVLFIGPTSGEIAGLLQREHIGWSGVPGDGAALAETIRLWQASPELRRQCGRHARAAYEKHFRFSAALARWEGLLLAGTTVDGVR